MDANAWVALLGIVLGLAGTVGGGIIKYLLGQVTEARKERELAERTADTKQETIEELRRQISRYEILTEITEKFYSSLPPRAQEPGPQQLPPSGKP